MRVDNSAGKGTSGMNKFGSVIDRMNIKLGSKSLNSLRIKTQLLKRLQRVIVVDGATHSQKDGVILLYITYLNCIRMDREMMLLSALHHPMHSKPQNIPPGEYKLKGLNPDQLPSGAGVRLSLQPSSSHRLFFFSLLEECYGTWYQSDSYFLINVGSGFHCLHSFPSLMGIRYLRGKGLRTTESIFGVCIVL
jgi:hypothetical protein